MNQDDRELLLDLLAKKATTGLDVTEQAELDGMGDGEFETELASFEMAAAAINMAGLSVDNALPSHLYSKIAAVAPRYVVPTAAEPGVELTSNAPVFTNDDVFAEKKGGSWLGWLGWVAAAAACIALAVNIWFSRTQSQPKEQAQIPTPAPAPRVLTPSEARDAMLASATTMVRAAWTAGNVKDVKEIAGDIVWSDEKQAGYMRLRGLPVNDPAKETYQLWIFDKTQDKATPIDGGTFDISSDGEVVIPINAKLKARGPEMFAITMEKPGGVVVSKREKLAAIAKVETQAG